MARLKLQHTQFKSVLRKYAYESDSNSSTHSLHGGKQWQHRIRSREHIGGNIGSVNGLLPVAPFTNMV